jgi:hypothetical protein
VRPGSRFLNSLAFRCFFTAWLLCSCLAKPGFAFNILPNNQIRIGQSIFIINPNPNYYYTVFWINLNSPNDADPCSFIAGSDAIVDNDLTHYGTCFVNDPGTFKIVELVDPLTASFTDSKASTSFSSFVSFNIKGYFPIPGIPVLIPSEDNHGTTTIVKPTFTVSCAAGMVVHLYADSNQIATGTCPSSGVVTLTSTVVLPYGWMYMTATQYDPVSDGISIHSDALFLIVMKRRIISFQ